MADRFPTRRENLEWMAVQDAGPDAIAAFDRMLAKGESVAMAAQLATRRPPRTGVNEGILHSNMGSVTQQFKGCEPMLQMYRQNYKAATGENLPEDAIVYRGLARYPGDPDCIVTHKHTLSEVKQKAKEHNFRVEGDWENHPRQQCPEGQVTPMSDMAMSRYKAEYRQLPEFERVDERDLEAEIISKHAKVMTGEQMLAAATSLEQVHKETFGG
jgi:hypothetical protein